VILAFASGFPLGSVYKTPSVYTDRGAIIYRHAESVIADALRPFYKSVEIYTRDRYESAMHAWYVAVDVPIVKVDVNLMYPTALLQLWRRGLVKADAKYINLIRSLVKYRYQYADRYIVALNVLYSDYAVYRKESGRRQCRTDDVEDYIDAEPTDLDTAVKFLNDAPCWGAVIRVKDLAKYAVLIAVGRIKSYDTASWHALISYAHQRFMSAVWSFRQHEGDEVLGTYVDTAFLFSKHHVFQRYLKEVGFDSKVDAHDQQAVVLLPVNYFLDYNIGAWLLGVDDKGVQNGVESDCDMYPRVCAFYVNRRGRFEHAGKLWCRYMRKVTDFVQCYETEQYVDIYIARSGVMRVSVNWGERDVLDAVKRAGAEIINYTVGFA
jgi:hypothetical protein